MLESEYQRQVIDRYEKAGYYVIKLLKTNKSGIPDLIALKKDDVVFIEVKGKKTEHRPLQKYRQRELEKYGFKVILDRSQL